MSPPRPTHDGVPRARGALAVRLGVTRPEEDWSGANEAKADTLRVRSLQRRARAQGVAFRHSDSGYTLIDAARKPVNGRHDMTLDEVESWLGRA